MPAGRPYGTTKEDSKIRITFRLSKIMIKWLKSKGNMTKTIEKLIQKEMNNEFISKIDK